MASCQLGRGPGLGSKPLCAQGFTTKSWMKNVEVSLHLLSTYLLTYTVTPGRTNFCFVARFKNAKIYRLIVTIQMLPQLLTVWNGFTITVLV